LCKSQPNKIHIDFNAKGIEPAFDKNIQFILFRVISERTVVGHKSNMLAKTGCKHAIGLLVYALRNKLVII